MAAPAMQRVRQALSDRTQLPFLLIPLMIPCCYWAYSIFTPAPVPNTANSTLFSAEELEKIEGTSATLTLPDGRKLGYAQYGLDTGRTVFYCHGFPGSRFEAASFDPIATRLGVRIIAVDRPGYGLSSPQPGRAMLDYAKDIEQLAKSLEADSFGVLGISGGGPYALACAAALPPEKLKSVSVVCGLGAPDMSKKGMSWLYWGGLAVGFPYLPALCRWWFSQNPATHLHLSDEKRLEIIQSQFFKSKPHPKDVAVVQKEGFRLYCRTSRQTFVRGLDAMSQDGTLLTTDWGFRLEDIRHDLPIQLWYGKLDYNVPIIHGVQIAERLGSNAHLRVEDETHMSIHVNWREQILGDLVEHL